MRDLVDTPDGFDRHIRRYATSVVLSSVFGMRGSSFEHPDVKEIYRVQDQFSEILEPGNTPPVDMFPILKYVPTFLAEWKQRAAKVRQGQQDLYLGLLAKTAARVVRGDYVNCFMDRLLTKEERQKHQLDDEHLAYVGGVMMEAGSDSTSSTLLSFVLAMVKHPLILQKAQREVDSICGDSRSPTFEDIPNLPYIQACVYEVSVHLRTPASLPR
jgi:cytochrome P450